MSEGDLAAFATLHFLSLLKLKTGLVSGVVTNTVERLMF